MSLLKLLRYSEPTKFITPVRHISISVVFEASVLLELRHIKPLSYNSRLVAKAATGSGRSAAW
jgi:hypothetical protein